MFCGNCGAKTEGNMNICPVCGAELNPAVYGAPDFENTQYGRQQSQAEAGFYESAREARPYPAPQEAQQPYPSQPAPFIKEKKKRSKGFAVAALVFAMLSAATCLIVYASFPLALAGLITAILGLRSEYRPMAIVALVICIIFLIWNILITVIALIAMKKYGFSYEHIRYFIIDYLKRFIR